MTHITRRFVVAAFLVLPFAAVALGADWSGTYVGQQLSIDLTAAGAGGYSGTIHMGNQQFPLTAQMAANGQLNGTFTSGGNAFAFAAVVNGDDMTLASGGSTYTLHRKPAAPVNPLAVGAAAATPAAGANVAAAPAGASNLTVLASNNSGRSLFIQKPQATSAEQALGTTRADLAQILGVAPHITGAFADQKEPTRGGASFTATVNNIPISGMILCGPGAQGGEVVTITYARNDAPAADRAALNAALPSSKARTQTYQFPDGTGSIELPEGWTTQAQTVIHGVQVKGPADQMVSIGIGMSVTTPTSQAVQMQRQLEANARQYGFSPPPPMKLLVAPFTGPVEAVQNLVPQLSDFSVAAGQPPMRLVQIVSASNAPAQMPNGRAALMTYLIDHGQGASAVRHEALGQIETYPLGGDGSQAWGVYMTELAAPQSHYDADLPTMMAIAKSLKTNDAAVAQQTQQAIAQSNQRFAAFERSMKEKNDAFDSYMQSVRNRELVNERTNADFDEVIRGYRTVEDTSTGYRTSVDLGNVHDVVEKLNEADPGRYKEIPLKDEMAPLPGQQ
jgi:hypothetical protein